MAEYRFHTEWRIDAPLESVWQVIDDYTKWPSWWR
jgi:hypothetical protein